MDDKTLSTLITLSALIVFVLSAWGTWCIFRARRGGWMRLAGVYGSRPRRDAMARRWQSVKLMPARVSYRWVVTVRLTVDGLHLRPILPFRFGHDALLIPWDEIEIFAIETYPADRLYELHFAQVPAVRMRVGVAVAQFIRRAADNVQYFIEERTVHVKAPLAPNNLAPTNLAQTTLAPNPVTSSAVEPATSASVRAAS